MELSTKLCPAASRVHGTSTEAGQAGDPRRAARPGAGQTDAEAQPSTDLSRASARVSRQPGDVGVTRDHLPVDLRSGTGRSEARVGRPPTHRESTAQAAAESQRATGTDSRH